MPDFTVAAASSVGALASFASGKAAIKLANVVAQGLGAVGTLILGRRLAEAEAEILQIRARSEAKALLVQSAAENERAIRQEASALAIRRLRESSELSFSEVAALSTEALLEKAGDRTKQLMDGIATQEAKRQRNLSSIAVRASVALPEEDLVSDEPVDPDWTARFFSAAQDVSTEEMQDLWARILAREVAQPGSVSLIALDILRNMTRGDAQLFQKAVNSSVEDKGVIQLVLNPAWAVGLEDLHSLDHLGLITLNPLASRYTKPASVQFAGYQIRFAPKPYPSGMEKYYQDKPAASFSYYPLTRSGKQIRDAVGLVPSVDLTFARVFASKSLSNAINVSIHLGELDIERVEQVDLDPDVDADASMKPDIQNERYVHPGVSGDLPAAAGPSNASRASADKPALSPDNTEAVAVTNELGWLKRIMNRIR